MVRILVRVRFHVRTRACAFMFVHARARTLSCFILVRVCLQPVGPLPASACLRANIMHDVLILLCFALTLLSFRFA